MRAFARVDCKYELKQGLRWYRGVKRGLYEFLVVWFFAVGRIWIDGFLYGAFN